jgi:uncharacterized damage-inducible protein DinB
MLGVSPPNPVAHLFVSQLDQLRHDLVRLAEAMPADGYGWQPRGEAGAGMRTFGEQVRHVATLMRITAAIVGGRASPVAPGAGNNGPAGIDTKSEILDALRLAFEEARAAALSFDEANQFQPIWTAFGSQTRAEVMTALVAHSYDHYGQMVVYARLSGVTPPEPGRPEPPPAVQPT